MFNPTSVLPAPGTPVTKQIIFMPFVMRFVYQRNYGVGGFAKVLSFGASR